MSDVDAPFFTNRGDDGVEATAVGESVAVICHDARLGGFSEDNGLRIEIGEGSRVNEKRFAACRVFLYASMAGIATLLYFEGGTGHGRLKASRQIGPLRCVFKR